MMRDRCALQKYISRAGAASRRQAERHDRSRAAILRSTVGTRHRPGRAGSSPVTDTVSLDGRDRRSRLRRRWVVLPQAAPGYCVPAAIPHGGRTVYDLLPECGMSGLRYVGRLDRDTSGPAPADERGRPLRRRWPTRAGSVEREYLAQRARVRITARALQAPARRGVELEDGFARPRRVRKRRSRMTTGWGVTHRPRGGTQARGAAGCIESGRAPGVWRLCEPGSVPSGWAG